MNLRSNLVFDIVIYLVKRYNIVANLVFGIGIDLVKGHTIGAFGFLLTEDLHILNSSNVGLILVEERQGSSYL